MAISLHALKSVIGMAVLIGLTFILFDDAQAQLPGESKLALILIDLELALLAPLTVQQLIPGTLLVPGRDLKLECKIVTESDVKGKINTYTDAYVKVSFLGCLSFSLSTFIHLPCVPSLDRIEAEALILPVLHGEQTFILFEPAPEKTNLAVVSYKSETECPLPLNNPVTGSVSASLAFLEVAQQAISFSPEIQLLTGDVLRFGGFPSYIHAITHARLTESHLNQAIGVH